MSILATFGGLNIIGLPCDTVPEVPGPSSIEWDPTEVVSVSQSPFTGQSQIFDWANSRWEGHVSFPPMYRYGSDMWSAFITECRGPVNTFMFGDPKAVLPKGPATGSPVVSGAGQTGYSLVTRGWTPSVTSIMLPGDYIQVGYRLYKVVRPVNSDSSGDATMTVWPNLRDAPADGVAIQTRNCKGLFRLMTGKGNKNSVNVGAYGFAGLSITEAF